jgi:hypothetical protein
MHNSPILKTFLHHSDINATKARDAEAQLRPEKIKTRQLPGIKKSYCSILTEITESFMQMVEQFFYLKYYKTNRYDNNGEERYHNKNECFHDYTEAITEYKKSFSSKSDVIVHSPDPAVREMLIHDE